MEQRLTTERLALRPFTLDDAPRVRALVGNWKVASMLARVTYPYGQELAEQWIAGHEHRRQTDADHPYAIEKDGELVGCIGLHRVDEGKAYDVGYWIGEPHWNKGIATEAGRALVNHAFEASPVSHLTAGHMAENHASGQVLGKLGFRYTGTEQIWNEARRAKVLGLRMVLKRRNG
ncbi:MAG: GNAT family N-acetyltransferase [Parvibaculum sp.]|nr:GNAT family N-acetyltransferase [Parvibaculum sp.]